MHVTVTNTRDHSHFTGVVTANLVPRYRHTSEEFTSGQNKEEDEGNCPFHKARRTLTGYPSFLPRFNKFFQVHNFIPRNIL